MSAVERQPLSPQSPAFIVTPKGNNYREHKTAKHHFSVSAQPTLHQLSDIQRNDRLFCVVDCRQETHLFVHGENRDDHGINITLHNGENDHNKGRESRELASVTHALLLQANKEGRVVVFREYGKCKTFDADNKKSKECFVTKRVELELQDSAHRLMTPRQVAEQMKYKYLHVPMTDHNSLSFLQNVDAMREAIIHAQESHKRIHFHCLKGVGRSVMSFLMAVIMDEAKEKTLEEIFKRFKAEEGFTSEVKKIKKMRTFLTHFHAYCKSSDFKSTSWSEWMEKNNISIDELNPKKKQAAYAPETAPQQGAKPVIDLPDIIWDAKLTKESPKRRTYFHLCADGKMRTSEKKALDQDSIRATVEIDKGIITKFIFKGVIEEKRKEYLKWFDDKGIETAAISIKVDEF